MSLFTAVFQYCGFSSVPIAVVLGWYRGGLYSNNSLFSQIGKYALKCCMCCLWCFEKIIKYFTTNTYIEIAVYGQSFCTSAKRVFALLIENSGTIPTPSSSSSLPRSLHSGAQHQSVGAAVRPIALIKSSTITGSLFKIPNPGLPPRWICLSRPQNLQFMRRCSTSSTTPHSGHILSLLPGGV